MTRAASDAAPGHKPPVLDGWSEDFTYGYYDRMLDTLVEGYRPILMRDAGKRVGSTEPVVIMRHDIDVCPRAALRMAKVESERGFFSTYFFMTNSPLYDIRDSAHAERVAEVASLGHEVALHFDLDDERRIGGCSMAEVEEQIRASAALVEAASGQEVRSVSFHRPLNEFLRGPLIVAGLVNAYARELMEWYVSDSNACWREGEPIPLFRKPRHSTLQILVHPIWWGDRHMRYDDRLASYCAEQADERGDIDERLFRGIGLARTHSNGARV